MDDEAVKGLDKGGRSMSRCTTVRRNNKMPSVYPIHGTSSEIFPGHKSAALSKRPKTYAITHRQLHMRFLQRREYESLYSVIFCTALPMLNLGAICRWVNTKPRPLYPRERTQVPIVHKAGWRRRPFWTGVEKLKYPPQRGRILNPPPSMQLLAIPTELRRPH